MPRPVLLAAALVGLSATVASAQDGGFNLPDGFGVELGAGTDNRSKAISKTQGDAYAYGIVDYVPGTGDVYMSGSIEGVDSSGADWETKLLVGWAPQFAGFDLDFNAAHKWLIDPIPGTDNGAWEFTANVSRSLGPASARVQYQYSTDALGQTGSFSWVEGRVGWAFTPRLEGTAAVGRREQRNSVDYTGWNVGATYALTRNLDLDVRWYDTDVDLPADNRYNEALVAEIRLGF
ncbi:MAG: TorF family putative porin [Brevundimonas sp.]|uniref:TorF family putative porin n=1 Tax=Brevundimonas sp. TaxID=1871086 RepID=UPI00391CF8A5